jgi:hypothetical protein
MFGNKRAVTTAMLCASIVVSLLTVAADATERRLPEKNFRLAIEAEPGMKFINGFSFNWMHYGLVFKIQERVSLIPHFGVWNYMYEKRMYGSTYDEDGSAISGGLTVRYEFVRRVVVENTRYEYDPEKREFMHCYFASPLRPYIQFHAGTFLGAGGGVLYNITQFLSLGGGVDLGINLLAQSDNETGFGIVAPKAVLVYSFL